MSLGLISYAANSFRRVHFLLALGSDDVSDKDTEVAARFDSDTAVVPRAQYRVVFSRLGTTKTPRHIVAIAHAEPIVEQHALSLRTNHGRVTVQRDHA